jgi:predicted transcriptional regulator
MTESNLTRREWNILEFIRNKPGVSKEEVVRYMKDDVSRITVLNILHRLDEEHMIVASIIFYL